MRTASTLALLLLLSPLAQARADEASVTRLAAVLKESTASANPAFAFLRGVMRIERATLNAAETRKAMGLAGIVSGDVLGQVLGPTVRLSKDAARIRIDRSSETVLRFESGRVRLAKTIELNLVEGAEPRLERISGIEVGKASGNFYTLKKVVFKMKNGRPTAEVTAGWLFITETMDVDLSPTEPAATAAAASGPGLAGALASAGH